MCLQSAEGMSVTLKALQQFLQDVTLCPVCVPVSRLLPTSRAAALSLSPWFWSLPLPPFPQDLELCVLYSPL